MSFSQSMGFFIDQSMSFAQPMRAENERKRFIKRLGCIGRGIEAVSFASVFGKDTSA